MKRISFLLVFCGCCAVISAQSDAYKGLAKYVAHIGYFNQLCPQEKVYLHLDNTAYFQGETIWFAANVVGSTSGEESKSKVLYVELLSPRGMVLKQQKLKVVNGRCHGSFALIDSSVKEALERRGPRSLVSGYYQIRAYTHAMLNFDAAGIYSRVIPVFPAPKKEGDYSHPVVAPYPLHEQGRPEVKESDLPKELNVAFYPEGGHIVAGLPCRVAFKATDENGLGINIESMTDANGLPITLSPQHKGMGYFNYVTLKGMENVKVTFKGKPYTFKLPKAEPQGCTMTVTGADKDELRVMVSHTELADSLLGYTLTSGGKVLAYDTLTLSRPTVVFDIDKRPFPTGVCQLTVFGASGVVYAQRLLFVDNGCATVPVEVLFDQAEYRPCSLVNLHIQVGNQREETFSLSVRDPADHGTAYQDDIRTYMLLSSELKGLIEDPGWYFSNGELEMEENEVNGDLSAQSDAQSSVNNSQFSTHNSQLSKSSALDLLMMVQGWTRYDWRTIAGVEPFEARHYTEEQLVLDGWAFSRIVEKPLKDVKFDISLYSPDRQFKQKATVTTDSVGYWSIGLEDFEGVWDLYYQTEQASRWKKNAMTRIKMERSNKPEIFAYEPLETYMPDYSSRNAQMKVWTEQEQQFMMPLDAVQLDEVEIKASQLYTDYGTFRAYDARGDCEEIFDNGEFTDADINPYLIKIGLIDEDYCLYDRDCELIIVNMFPDGESVRSKPAVYKNLYDSGQEYVQSVFIYDTLNNPKVLPCIQKTLPYCDPIVFPSNKKYIVVEVILGKYQEASRRGKNSRATTFKGYDTPVEFYAPTYPDGPVQGDKDYRRTVYWNPEVTTDANGVANVSFYNNGYSRTLTVSAEGLTADGVPILNQ